MEKREITLADVCEWVNTHEEGRALIEFMNSDKRGILLDLDKADDTALRKSAGTLCYIEGWLSNFEEHKPPTDRQ